MTYTTTELANIVTEVERLTLEKQIIVRPENEAKNVYYLRGADGEYERKIADLDPYNVLLGSLDSLIEFAGYEEEHEKKVYIGSSSVKVVDYSGLDDTRSVHTLELPPHPLFQWALRHNVPVKYGQKELLTQLRLQLSGCVPSSFVQTLQNVRFEKRDEGNSSLQRGNEGLDRTIVKKVESAGAALPAELTLNLPVYNLKELRSRPYPIEFKLESDVEDNGKLVFWLYAMPNDLRDAQEAALEYLMDLVCDGREGDTPVVSGQPERI